MDDDESRPATAHRAPRKVPGSFDDDEISPTKENFDDIQPQPTTALKPDNIPHLHPPLAADHTFFDGSSLAADKVSDSFTEQAVHQHLQDMEPSFAVPLSPIHTSVADAGADDTLQFGSPTKPAFPSAAPIPSPPLEEQSLPAQRATPPPESGDAQPGDADVAEPGNSTSALEAFSSSPTATNTARTVSSAFSRASDERGDSGFDGGDGTDADQTAQTQTAESRSRSTSLTGASTLRHQSSEIDFRRLSTDAGSTPGHALKYGKRPRYLRSRNASQRSSASSFVTSTDSHDDVDSDLTVGLGTDYALQSGGAVPTLSMSRSMSNILSRSVSMGSMLSGMDDFHDSSGRLETLDEDVKSPIAADRPDGDDDLLRTPRAKGPPALPTDTTIARRVRDVHVPDSLRGELKAKGNLITPRKPSEGSLTGAQRRNMTLKEQHQHVERLSKENFDLKLKVMFLTDRLNKLSEDGLKEMALENVELRTNVTVLQRDNKALRKRLKELEKQIRDENERPSTAQSATSSNGQTNTFDPDARGREADIIHLREVIEEYTTEIERLRHENMNKEAEKRRMAEVVKSLQTLGEKNAGENIGRQEAEDVWKDLLEQETARREQADEENRKLRDEIFRMKQDMAGPGLHHTTNIYNITKKQPLTASPSRPVSAFSGEMDAADGGMSAASTLVEELRRESEQLRHENAELRREVGAQTSMLTSRNKEKERLYQEIEDLKLAQRRGGPAPSTIDSLLDRSASQIGARDRPASRASGGTRAETAMDDAERDELEGKNAELRDKINEARHANQSLQQELETALDRNQEVEEAAMQLQHDLETAENDLMVMQAERDELAAEWQQLSAKHENLKQQFENLREEAQEAIDGYEHDLEQRELELGEKQEGFLALQEEMRKLSGALLGLEDDQIEKVRRTQQLEQEVSDANKESEELETKLLESNDKNQRLLVQQENSQGEIAFLREEQEADKVKISELEVAINKLEEGLREEQDRVKQMERQITTERDNFVEASTKEKKDVQAFVNELHRENSTYKDEVRRLRKSLSAREVEATEWKERLVEFENNLRHALGDLNGTRSSFLKAIAKMQRELENTVRELDATKASLMEKDRIIKQRDGLLESHGLESRKLGETLEKERVAHRNTRNQFETFQKTHQHVSRTVTSQDQRIVELETTKSQDKKRLSLLESQFKDQLNDRNNLLLVLWTRLSSLCGTDWAHDNSLINGRALPSLEAVATMLPGFSKNLLGAVKTIESIVGGFRSRIGGVEKDLWREYQSLENNLEVRTKKLERLEAVVRNGIASGAIGSAEMQSRLARLEEAYRRLKVENATLRTASEVRARAAYAATGDPNAVDPIGSGSPSPSIPTGPRDHHKERPRPKTGSRIPSRTNTMTRSLTAGELALQEREGGGSPVEALPNDPRWILRLRDLENKLKMEREGRTLDRNEATRRLLEQEAELNRRSDRERRRVREDENSG